MKIKKIECEQFAGIRDKNIEFKDSINILYGKNESGKSTVLELLHALLFQKTSLDKRTDKEFINKNFSHNANGADGDVIDGKIVIENENDVYALTKEWEVKGGSERIKDKSGTLIKNSEEIDKILNSLLQYEQGVYDEIIFSSQKIPQNTLESIFGECKKEYDVKKELHGMLMKSVSEIGGANIDAIENKIIEKLKALSLRFDMVSMAPEGGANKEWKKETGEIYNVYDKLRKAKREKDEILGIETKIEEINKEKKELVDERTKINNEMEEINKYSNIKLKKDSLLRQIGYQEEVIRDGEKVIPIWEKYENDKKIISNKKVIEVSKDDVKRLKKLQSEYQDIKSKLGALDLDVKIDNKSGKELKVTSTEAGDVINGNNNIYSIKGCAEFDLPEIINIKLMPKDIDIDSLSSRQKEINENVNILYDKYNVKDIDALEKLQEEYETHLNELNKIKESGEGYIKTYEEKYNSIDGLKTKINDAKKSIEKLNKDLENIENIPEEIDDIEDFDEYKQDRKERLDEIDGEIEEMIEELQEESENLAGRDSDSFNSEIEELTQEFDAKVTEYKHYENIHTKFLEIKKQIETNPMSGIEKKFNEYLKQISQNNISIIDGANIDDVQLKSNNNRLTVNTLSEGTKATIGIAFKLSVIEHLFPDGNGLAIFDDPFTDMDEDRMKEACNLINQFGTNNQVIFVTCDKKYLSEFPEANVINM